MSKSPQSGPISVGQLWAEDNRKEGKKNWTGRWAWDPSERDNVVATSARVRVKPGTRSDIDIKVTGFVQSNVKKMTLLFFQVERASKVGIDGVIWSWCRDILLLVRIIEALNKLSLIHI